MAQPTSYRPRDLPNAPRVELAVRPHWNDDTASTHPATAMSMAKLLALYSAAENGEPLGQFDAFDDYLGRDGHLITCDEGRRLPVAGANWILKPGDDKPGSIKAAEDLDRILRTPAPPGEDDFQAVLDWQMLHVSYGFSPTNMAWGKFDGTGPWAPVRWKNVAHRRFAALDADNVGTIALVNGDSTDRVPLEPGAWIVTRYPGRNPWSSGRMRAGAMWAMFKSWSLRDWLTFAEMFGMPTAIGFYEAGASIETRRALENLLRQIGSDGYGVLEDTTDVVLKDSVRSGDASSVFPAIWDKCEAQMSKAYAGGTLTIDAGTTGSYAQASTHEGRSFILTMSDAIRLQAAINRDVCGPFIAWNGYGDAAPPRLKFQIMRSLSLKERAEIFQILATAFPGELEFDEDQIREEFQLRKPTGKGLAGPKPEPKIPPGGSAPPPGEKGPPK